VIFKTLAFSVIKGFLISMNHDPFEQATRLLALLSKALFYSATCSWYIVIIILYKYIPMIFNAFE